MWKLWAITALFTLSCGMTEAPTEPSRLRRNVLHASDGTTLDTLSFFDTKRQEDCTFQQVGERLYCVPMATRTVGVFFSDEACKSPAIWASKCATQPALALHNESSACGGDKFFTLKQIDRVYNAVGTACKQADFDTTQYYLYALGAEVPLSTFVSASMTTH